MNRRAGGASGGGVKGMAGSSGIKRRGRLGAETDLERDRDGSGEDNTVLDGDSRNKNYDSIIGGISNGIRGLWVGNRVGSVTSVLQYISKSFSSSSTNTPTGTDAMAGSRTWSAGTSCFSS